MSAVAKLQAVLDEYAGFTNEIVEADREALATVLRDLAALRERVAKVNALAVSRVPPDDEVNFPGCLICGLCGGCDGARGEPLKHSKDCPVTILAGSDVHTERGCEPAPRHIPADAKIDPDNVTDKDCADLAVCLEREHVKRTIAGVYKTVAESGFADTFKNGMDSGVEEVEYRLLESWGENPNTAGPKPEEYSTSTSATPQAEGR